MNLVVEGMTCGHCVQAITRAIQARDPHAQVQVDLSGGVVQINGTRTVEAAVEAIQAEGYVVAAVLDSPAQVQGNKQTSCCGGCHR
jgi:copper chaperone